MKKRYIVTGPHQVGGAKTGEAIELDLLPHLERHLIDTGHIKPAPPPPKKASTEREHD